jgi:hypothetical protein
MTGTEDQARLLFLLETAAREGRHLTTTTRRLFSKPIDIEWVRALESEPDESERLVSLLLVSAACRIPSEMA